MGTNEKLYINGIDGVTGEYLVPPLEYNQAAALIKGESQDANLLRWLSSIWRIISQPNLGLPFDVDPTDVRQAGWAVVFHTEEDEAVKQALAPLIEHRKHQINNDTKCKVLAYREGESRAQFLARYGIGAGSIEPTKVPFYLLLVGSTERIPFSFGHLLSVEYAVGRLHFDTAAGYTSYVASLIDYETSQSVPNAKEVVFFATRHPFDRATQLSADLLVHPLADGVPATGPQLAQPGIAEQWGFRMRKFWGQAATKSTLVETLMPGAGVKPPALLFTASHGMGWPRGHANQRPAQGALLCQDWPGVGTISQDHYFAASDVPAAGRVYGMITFHFACYGAGTPSHDRFIHRPGEPPPTIADQPFIAALPKTLFTHPQGGALACIGHVERAWGYSITAPKAGPQLLPFQNAIGRILVGQPVGYVMKDFYEKYAALSTSLSSLLEELTYNPNAASDEQLAANWIERNDAEGYIILGDPAAHLRVSDLQ